MNFCKKHRIQEIEPYANGIAALKVPEEGIVDYSKVCDVLKNKIVNSGGSIILNYDVQSLSRNSTEWVINKKSESSLTVDYLINTAGLHTDRICKKSGMQTASKIIPFRGEYYKLKKHKEYLVKNLIYPVPDPKYPFLGVHFTRQINGGIEAGPNAVLALSREGYSKWQIKLRDLTDSLCYPGLWRFIKSNYKMCIDEIRRSYSKDLFCKSLQELIPDVQIHDLTTGGAGVRAQAMNRNGKLEQDFVLLQDRGMLNVLNAPSPAATASLSIADYLLQLINNALDDLEH